MYPALAVASALAAKSQPQPTTEQSAGDVFPAFQPNAQDAVHDDGQQPSPDRGENADGKKGAGDRGSGIGNANSASPNTQHPTPNTFDVLYIGSVGGMEQGIVAEESTLPFRAIRAAALRGRGPVGLARNAMTLQAGIWQARALLRELRPSAILGTGGYVCVPLFLAARMVGVPTMIYLPDIVPGLAIRFLSRIATRVACSFEPSLRYLPRAKTVVTGYPLRPSVGQVDRTTSRATFGLHSALPVLLVYGGSRGSRSINRAIERLMKPLLELCEIIHVCGREGDEMFLAEAVSQLPAVLRERYHLHPYLAGTMPEAFAAADVTVCRSGASTLAELPAVGLPAVLVPYPYVHQDENAAYLTERGAAVTVTDAAMLGTGQATEGPLFQAVQRLLLDQEARATMANHSRSLARPDAAERLASELIMLAR